MDNKRRYLNARMSHEDRREERRDKRAARAEGKAEIAAQMEFERHDCGGTHAEMVAAHQREPT